MSEMIERVADILAQDDAGIRPVHRVRARAIIEAMLEPTEIMQAAGAYLRENRKPVADIWRAMIAAALED